MALAFPVMAQPTNIQAGAPAAGAAGAARVEAYPAEPEDAGAQDDEGHVVWLHGFGAIALALAVEDGGGEGGGAGVDVNCGAAREVEGVDAAGGETLGVERREPAVEGEDPVRDGGVDKERPGGHEYEEGGELGALGGG